MFLELAYLGSLLQRMHSPLNCRRICKYLPSLACGLGFQHRQDDVKSEVGNVLVQGCKVTRCRDSKRCLAMARYLGLSSL